jgi:hypothetical protein
MAGYQASNGGSNDDENALHWCRFGDRRSCGGQRPFHAGIARELVLRDPGRDHHVAVGICGPDAIARDFPAVTLPAIIGTVLIFWAVAEGRAADGARAQIGRAVHR